jgi:hypothetical protein
MDILFSPPACIIIMVKCVIKWELCRWGRRYPMSGFDGIGNQPDMSYLLSLPVQQKVLSAAAGEVGGEKRLADRANGEEASYLPSREAQNEKAGNSAPSGSPLARFTSAWKGALKSDGGPASNRNAVREEKTQEALQAREVSMSQAEKQEMGVYLDRAQSHVSALRFPPYLPSIKPRAAEPSSSDSGKQATGGGIDVRSYQKKLQEDIGPLAHVQNEGDIDGIDGEVPTTRELQQFFDKIKSDPKLPWEYLNEGCYARAHETSKELMKKGYNAQKLFVEVDNSVIEDPSKRLHGQNKFTRGEWSYHVAPLVFAKDEKTGNVDGYVLDPSVNGEKPIKADEWVKKFWNGKIPIALDVTRPDTFQPPRETTPSVPHQFSRQEFDKWMEETEGSNRDFADVLGFIKEKYYAKHPQEMARDGWKPAGA